MCLPLYHAEVKHEAWIVIYTCPSIRAIILDIVHSYQFVNLNSFKRFIARRGYPSTVMVSDNGEILIKKNTQTFVSNHFINWKINVEKTLWWGRIWERLVFCVKRCIKK